LRSLLAGAHLAPMARSAREWGAEKTPRRCSSTPGPGPQEVTWSGRNGASLRHSPLRTVLAGFLAHGSSESLRVGRLSWSPSFDALKMRRLRLLTDLWDFAPVDGVPVDVTGPTTPQNGLVLEPAIVGCVA
jgi:hypothetical protein